MNDEDTTLKENLEVIEELKQEEINYRLFTIMIIIKNPFIILNPILFKEYQKLIELGNLIFTYLDKCETLMEKDLFTDNIIDLILYTKIIIELGNINCYHIELLNRYNHLSNSNIMSLKKDYNPDKIPLGYDNHAYQKIKKCFNNIDIYQENR